MRQTENYMQATASFLISLLLSVCRCLQTSPEVSGEAVQALCLRRLQRSAWEPT